MLDERSDWADAVDNDRFGPQGVTCGVVYLHDISQDGHMRTAGQVLPLLIEDMAFGSVMIATTKWDRSFGDEGEMREAELKQKFWSKVVQKGCTVHRHSGPQSSSPGQHNAVELIGTLLQVLPIG